VAPAFWSSRFFFGAGWSSPVARQAHNLKVAGSNPAPATKINPQPQQVSGFFDSQVNLHKVNVEAPWKQ
jgi:hypothetical protein